MLRREMIIGYRRRRLPRRAGARSTFWHAFFITGHGIWTSIENAIVGPFIALISFVCSIGNVPLAAALWKGGISFGGVISFIFADLIALPLVLIYRKFYGTRLALRMLARVLGRDGRRRAGDRADLQRRRADPAEPARSRSCPSTSTWNYTTILNIVFVVIFGVLYFLYRNRDQFGGGDGYAIDPVCGMQVEKSARPAPGQRRGQELLVLLGPLLRPLRATPTRFPPPPDPRAPPRNSSMYLPAVVRRAVSTAPWSYLPLSQRQQEDLAAAETRRGSVLASRGWR